MDINGVNASELYSAYQPQRLKAIVEKRLEDHSAEKFKPNDVEKYNQSIVARTNSVDVEVYNPKSNGPAGNVKGNLIDLYA